MATFIIIGAGTLPAVCAERVLARQNQVLAVVPTDAPLHTWATHNHIPSLSLAQLAARPPARPEFLLSIANLSVLSPAVLALPTRLALNYHDAPLPRYAGLNATQWALWHGESTHGVSWHAITEVIDAGEVYARRTVPIGPTDTALTLNAACYAAALAAFDDLLSAIETDTLTPHPQDISQRTYFGKAMRPPRVLSWHEPAATLHQHMRALDTGPYANPLGWPLVNLPDGSWVSVRHSQLTTAPPHTPAGTVLARTPTEVVVACANATALRLTGWTTLAGERLTPDDRFPAPGQQWPDPPAATVPAIHAALQNSARHDDFWRAAWAKAEPTALPHPQHLTPASGWLTGQVAVPPGLTPPQTLALGLAWLARVVGQNTVHVGLDAGPAAPLHARLAPLTVPFDLDQPFEPACASAVAALTASLRRPPPPLDLPARFPGLPPSLTWPVAISAHPQANPAADFTLAAEAGAVHWQVRAGLFDAPVLAALTASLHTFAQAALTAPSLAEAALTSPAMLGQFQAWNATAAQFPTTPVGDQIAARCAAHPHRLAVSAGDQHLTAGDLLAQAHTLAAALRALGVGPESLVAVKLERTPALVTALLGVWLSGAAYLPLDPAFPADRLDFMLADSGAQAVLASPHATAPAPFTLHAQWPDVHLWHNPHAPAPTHFPADRLAYVLYTSGSTGKPKGVAVTHANLSNFLHSLARTPGLGPHETLAAVTTLSFDIAGLELWLPLLTGARLELVSRATATDGTALARWLTERGVTAMQATPATWRLLLEAGWPGAPGFRALCGGEALPRDLARALLARVAELWNLYGPTETTIWSTLERITEAEATITIGRPIANTTLHIVDGRGQPTPVGVPGELCIGGAGVARGYLHRPELTAAKFFALPDGSPAYRTGDLARWLPDGRVDFLGRRDFQVKIRGFRIELGEIEAALATHPAVAQAVVTTHADTLAAYVVARSPLPADDLRAHLRATLPDYMVPTHWVFLPHLPLTPNGKIDRQALPAPLAAARPTPRPPKTAVERTLATIWGEVLNVSEVGLDDDFFALGGHSLSAARVLGRIRRELNATVELPTLFAAPTIAALAQRLTPNGQDPAAAPELPTTPVPATPQQVGLWLVHQLDPEETAYTLALALDLHGPLSEARLQTALNALWQRHDALRLALPGHDGHPHLHLLAATTWPLTALAAAHDTQADVTTPFDVEHGPLARATLIRHTPTHHTLRLCLHHTIADGASLEVLVTELAALYAGHRLPPAPAYRAYAHAQQHADFGVALAHWRDHLRHLPEPLLLPTPAPRPALPSLAGARHSFEVPPDLAQAVRTLAAAHKATPFMLAVAALAVVLHRYTNQTDLLIGVPWHNRPTPTLEPLVGLLMNPVALRVDMAGNPTLAELLNRVRHITQAALAHGAAPLEQVIEAVQPRRQAGLHPLFQVMLAWQTPLPQPHWPDLTAHAHLLDTHTAKFDLTLTVTETHPHWQAALDYRTDLFTPDYMERLAGHWLTVLAAWVAQPATPLAHAPLLTPAEADQLHAWVTPAPQPFTPICLHTAVAHWATATPHAPALADDSTRLTYAELNTRANQVAHFLLGLGLQPDDVVGLCAERSAEMVVLMLGVLKAGAAYLPLEADLPTERLAHMLAESGARRVLAQSHLCARLPATTPVTDLGAAATTVQAQPTHDPATAVTPANLAYVLFTSGSTGKPKGVGVEHRHLSAYVAGVRDRLRLPPGARYATVSTLAADLGLTAIYPALTSGGELRLVAADTASDPDALAELFHAHPVDCLKIVPSHLAALLSAAHPAAVLPRQCLVLGGEALSWALVRRVRALAPQLRVLNHYGPTETTVGVVTFETPFDLDTLEGTVPLGYALPHTQLHVLSAHRQPAPVGVPGELYIAGAQVARGYLNRPDLTAERFITLTEPPVRAYRTGDWVRRRADGALEFLGRVDHQVKIRGYRVELGEIEAALLQAGPVQAAVVVARAPNPEAPQHLVAYVVPHAEAHTPDLRASLRVALRDRLPDYMQPAALMVLPALPLTANGKIDRAALPEPTFEAAPASAAPQTPTERTLAALWQEVLRVPQVNRYDNFFALGGDSILGIQLVARAHRAQLNLLPRHIFQHQTLAELAQALQAAPPPPTLAPAAAPLTAPLTPIQHWFFATPRPAPHHWNMPLMWQAAQPLHPDLTRRAWLALIEHHAMWRARFTLAEAGWQQHLAPASASTNLWFEWAEAATPQAAQAKLAEWGHSLPQRLNLAAGPLVAVGLVVHGQHATVLVVVHHLVMDGVSWRIIGEDFEQVYAQLEKGQPPTLPAPSTPFLEWADRLPGLVPQLAAEHAYWHALAALAPRQHHPWGHEGETRTHTLTLSAALTARVLKAARATHINSVLLTALAHALHEADGQPTHLIDLEGHGREDVLDGVNLSRTVGWFTTHYPMLVRASTLADMHTLWQAVPGRGLGYGVLRYLAHDPALATPDPEIAFNYLGQFEANPAARLTWLTAPGPSRHALSPRQHRLEVNAQLSAGRLQVDWLFAPPHDTPAQVAHLAARFAHHLRRLAATPPPTGHPLTALQQHMAQATSAGVYHPQFTFVLRGRLNLARLRRAWQAVLHRHAALRVFVAAPGTQQVAATARLRWHVRDGRGQPAARLAAWRAAEALTRFDLSAPPLFRVLVVRQADEVYEVVWTSHHLIKDGWSSVLIGAEVWAAYAGHALEPAPQWLTEVRPWPEPPLAAPRPGVLPPAEQVTMLSAAATSALLAWARQNQLTLATVCASAVQAAVQAAVHPEAGPQRLGWVVAERPAQVAGVEQVVGPLLAVRPVHPPASLHPAALRAWQAEPPALPPPLFDPAVVLRVQTFPRPTARTEAALTSTGLTMLAQTWVDAWAFPLNVVVEPGERLTVRATFDMAHWPPQRVAAMLGRVRHTLLNLLSQP